VLNHCLSLSNFVNGVFYTTPHSAGKDRSAVGEVTDKSMHLIDEYWPIDRFFVTTCTRIPTLQTSHRNVPQSVDSRVKV